jgi:hypothetical protein
MMRRRVRRVRRVKSKLFYFAVLRGGIPGKAEKNEPKTPDALVVLDVGPGEAARAAAGFHNFGFKDFPIADTQISELGVCCHPFEALMPLLNFSDSGDFVQPHAQAHVAYFSFIAFTFWALL